MLIVGALALAVPVLGWQSVKQLDTSLKQSRIDAQNLKVANARIALAEAQDLQTLLDDQASESVDKDLFAERARYPLFVDGYADDWRMLDAMPVPYPTLAVFSASQTDDKESLSVRVAQYKRHVFLFIRVIDNVITYHKPPRLIFDAGENERPDENRLLINGDSLELVMQRPGETPIHYLFKAIAPGNLSPVLGSDIHNKSVVGEKSVAYSVRKKHKGGAVHNARAYWVDTQRGAQIEIRLPAPPLGTQLAIAYRDIDEAGQAPVAVLGDFDPEKLRGYAPQLATINFRPLYHTSAIASRRLEPWVTADVRARLYDKRGRLLADVNSLYEQEDTDLQLDPARGSLLNAILFRLFSYFVSDEMVAQASPAATITGFYLDGSTIESLKDGKPQTGLYDTDDNDRVLGTVLAIGGESPNGYLLFESNEDPRAAYASSRLARIFSLLTLVSVLTGGVLFVYATVLSMRIRKLSQQAGKAVTDEGRVMGLSQSSAKDEIGDLSRNLASLLTRSANYTQYLEALSSRLSHELRTPLSVVKTSIENLDRDQLDQQSLTLIDRANSGAEQLGSIIKALVESTRLEQTVQQSQMETINLSRWFEAQLFRYQQIYPQLHISATSSLPEQYSYRASPELLEQAMDKLVSNAAGFTTDGNIRLELDDDDMGNHFLLMVANTGKEIEKSRLGQLFDPMFSERAQSDGELHLGLGLYIVRMIAEAHGGIALAANSPPEVRFGMKLPLEIVQ
jgi:signal transduction histidine kinase